MAQSPGAFLVSQHGPPGFNARLPISASPVLKRPSNGPIHIANPSNTSMGPNMSVSSSSSLIRSASSMGVLKTSMSNMNPLDKSNAIPYSSRYTRKVWPTSRSLYEKNSRGYDEHETSYMRLPVPPHGIPTEHISSTSFTIEPSADDDEGDDIIFSSRHIAAARFQRNQRLLCEMINEVCIPDLRSNVNVDRILTLRRQVGALKAHRETFEKDLNELEEKHAEKKRKFSEMTERFRHEYTEASLSNLNPDKITEILQKREALEKSRKEKQQLLQQHLQQPQQSQQQQEQSSIAASEQTSPLTTISQPTLPATAKTEPVPPSEVQQQQQTVTPAPFVQTQILPVQNASASSVPSHQSPTSLTHAQPSPSPLPPAQTVSSSLPMVQSTHSQIPSSNPMPSQPALSQPLIHAQIPYSQTAVQHQLSQQPPVMAAAPPSSQQHQTLPSALPPQPTTIPQGYPMIHQSNKYVSVPGYGHPQQTQYRPSINQRSTQYPTSVQWQQQQWQTNAYDSRYYNAYSSNVQWQQQQQQWSPSQPQQPVGMMSPPQQSQPQPSQMRASLHQQQSSMYANYGYGSANAGWTPSSHPSQQYSYPAQNSSYDSTLASVPPPPPPPPMHNPPSCYDYGPSFPQQQMPPQ